MQFHLGRQFETDTHGRVALGNASFSTWGEGENAMIIAMMVVHSVFENLINGLLIS